MEKYILEDLSFSVDNSNYSTLERFDTPGYRGFTKIINLKRGVKVINRRLICREDLLVNYNNPLPSETTVGAISLQGTSESKLYDIKTDLIHKSNTVFWGNVPNESCASFFPREKSLSILYISVSESFFREYEFLTEKFSDNQLLKVFSGQYHGIHSTGRIPIHANKALEQILELPLNTPADWLLMESALLNILASGLNYFSTREGSELKLTKDEIERLHFAREQLLLDFENPPSIMELSKIAGMNDFKLKKAFKQIFGLPIYEYLKRYRFDQAKRLLTFSDLSITEIAFRSGYSNPGAFATSFKKDTAFSPKEYRDIFARRLYSAEGLAI
ncbi:MAG: helix-turn-helix transcriptional regulator [Spirochaetales bacterium]|nr:helix-turn-helix transcriptional regulator [Spirochaetales bacterium]